ncbi:MAG: PadR family transcriptional regulator [Halobacteriales archaeon]
MQIDEYSDWRVARQGVSEFQYSILFVLANGADYGLRIKSALQDYYGEEINHGRLYPNLNKLTEGGLLQKSEIDNRTNEYGVTEEGLALALDRIEWALENMVPDDEAGAIVSRVDELVLGD